jgi:glycerol-3-phosphate O-acyltransferase/dihydroxyacetone phosphate acyltransferase
MIDNVTPESVPTMIKEFVEKSPTTSSPLEKIILPKTIEGSTPLTWRHCPHRVLILLCSQRTRDARCGQSAPLLRRELERHLRPLGLYRDLDDERPGGVGVYFISHVGGHKYSANMMVYRRPDAFGIDKLSRAQVGDEELRSRLQTTVRRDEEGGDVEAEVGAGECIWIARVKPEDCENIVRYTVLQGKVVKPETQLRGGFNRTKGLFSW